jgi:hypothetical protein
VGSFVGPATSVSRQELFGFPAKENAKTRRSEWREEKQ